VSSGVNGWLFNTKEEAVSRLSAMLEDTGTTREMGRKSRVILEESYSRKAMGEGYRKVYGEAAGL
jgi:glycosyltransferase involved in cell wall biosynthesis